MDSARYRIGTVARVTGLSTHVIRVWERRYGLLSPDRSGGGARLYSDADVERLRLLKRALDRGHAISQIAHLEPEALSRLTTAPAEERPTLDTDAENYGVELIEAVRAFDLELADRILARAALTLSPRSLIMDVLGPTLRRVGDEWAAGKLCVASEHVASVLVRDRAAAMLRAYSPQPDAETLVVTTPAGELHELGALLAAVTAAMQGYRIAYLGPNLPAGEIAAATRAASASLVALSLVALELHAAVREVRAVRGALPQGVTLLLGGAAAADVALELGAKRDLVVPGTLLDFEDWLVKRKQAPRSRRKPAE